MKRISTAAFLGAALIAIGALALINAAGIADVGAVLAWTPSLFIAFGLWKMIARRFRGILGPSIIILVAALVQMNMLDVDWVISFPVILIAAGVLLLLGRKRLLGGGRSGNGGGASPYSHQSRAAHADEMEMDDTGFLRVTAALGSSSRRVSSDEFRGGEIVAFMGTSKLDMRDLAAPSSPAALEVNCVMGNVELRIPPEWSVQIDNTVVMGEAKDNRPRALDAHAATDLTVTGAVVMGNQKIED